MKNDRPVRCFADGGLFRCNPSPIGGAWAYRLVNCYDMPVGQNSGLLLVGLNPPEEIPPGRGLTNNLTEYVAMVMALEALPSGWSGEACTDSLRTIHSLFGRVDWPQYVPPFWGLRAVAARARLGHVVPVHMGGHPNRQELRSGITKRGYPCSLHQHWCDQECTRRMQAYLPSPTRTGATGARRRRRGGR